MIRNRTLNYAIIENEEFARINLRCIIESLRPGYKCVFTAETIEDSVELINRHSNVGLIFMDIELDDGNCFEIFRRTDVSAPVVFTTAYDEYALKAFKVNSIDYLMKPISEADVEAALTKFESGRGVSGIDHRGLADTIAPKRSRSRMLINDGANYYFVRTDDIAWFEAEDKYVFIVLKTGKRLLTDYTSLSDVSTVLDTNEFFRISRSVVASISAICKVEKYFKGRLKVTLQTADVKCVETISAACRPEFLDWLGHN